MLNSIDLFSGLGGITHSLRGFVRPLCYCDIDPICRETIEARIASHDLPEAPVLRDVRDTRSIVSAVSDRKVDIIISSSSCVGFSTVGSRKGLAHPETKLFLDVLDLLELFKAPMLLMENVRAILTSNGGTDYRDILKRFARMGYRVTWCVLKAEHVGGWHERSRWFALAYKPSAVRGKELRLPTAFKTIRRFNWSKGAKPVERLALPKKSCPGAAEVTASRNRRLKMLGNAVVPDCVRLAFMYLFSGGKVTDITRRSVRHAEFSGSAEQWGKTDGEGHIRFPPFGVALVNGVPREHAQGSLPYTPANLRLAIDPSRGSGGNRAGAIKTPIVMTRYMTPRAQNVSGGCKAATDRCLGDLGTQTRFMRGVPHVNGHQNPEFVEFLMGVKRNWTHPRIALRRKT